MKRLLTAVCLLSFFLSQAVEGSIVLARTLEGTETTTGQTQASTDSPTESTTSETTTSELPTEPTTSSTSEELPTTTSQEAPITSAESPTTTSEATTEMPSTQAETKTNQEKEVVASENNRMIGGSIEVAHLPYGAIGVKIRLDTLVQERSSTINFDIISNKTGKTVRTTKIEFDELDQGALKDRSNLGKFRMFNVYTREVGTLVFKDDPTGTYTLKVHGQAYRSPSEVLGQVNIQKTINIGSLSRTSPDFPKVGTSLETMVLLDGQLIINVATDTLSESSKTRTFYKITHNGTGKVIEEGRLSFRTTESSYLKNSSNLGKLGFNNAVTITIPAYRFKDDPNGTYTVHINGTIANDKTAISGMVDVSRTVSLGNRTTSNPSFKSVTPRLDAFVLPSRHIALKVRFDELMQWSNLGYQIIDQQTGRVVYSSRLKLSQVDQSVLKNTTYLGQKDAYNTASDVMNPNYLHRDQTGTYIIKVFGVLNKDGKWENLANRTVFATKTLSLKQPTTSTQVFPTVGGRVNTNQTPEGGLNVTVRLDKLVRTDHRAHSTAKIIHKKTGRLITSTDLYFREVDEAALKDKTNLGAKYFGNMSSFSIPPTFFTEKLEDYTILISGVYKEGDNVDSIIMTRWDGSVKGPQKPTYTQPVGDEVKDVYRLYHPQLKTYVYTMNKSELKPLAQKGWRYEGLAWRASTKMGEPVYRLYNPKSKEYFYTKNVDEYDKLMKQGWKKEGTAFRSFGGHFVFRLRNLTTQKYLYTRNLDERARLVKQGWRSEGVAWTSYP